MKRKGALLTAAICFGAGLLIMLTALCLVGFDLSALNSAPMVEQTMEIASRVYAIEIQDVAGDVSLLPSPDDVCRVHYTENRNLSYTIRAENGKLIIKSQDQRKWYQRIGIHVGQSAGLVVELPANSARAGGTALAPTPLYDALFVETVSGNIHVGEQLSFAQATLSSTSGDIRCAAEVSGVLAMVDKTVMRLYAETVSGDILIACEGAGGYGSSIAVKTTSGDIVLSGFRSDTLSAQTTSGDVTASGVTINEEVSFRSVSGDLNMKDVRMKMAALLTTSGDIRLELPAPMNFVAQTTSGNVKLPDSDASAGDCELTTTSGDIEVVLLKSN